MPRRRGLILIACWLFTVAVTRAADPDFQNLRGIRSPNVDALQTLAAIAAESPTLRDVIARIERSDVVAYLMIEPCRVADVGAQVSFTGTGGGLRYVRVSIDPRFSGAAFSQLLAHELQHVAEIADQPSVVDARSLAALYRVIGYRTDSNAERFETEPAIRIARRVMREIQEFRQDTCRHRVCKQGRTAADEKRVTRW